MGLVGCGRNSDNHLRVYSNTKGVRLTAVCDTDSARAEEKARKYGVEQVFTDFDSMLDLDLDLVDIVTPTPTHVELSVLALESGQNVLVEKPMALSSKECIRMIDAANKSERTLCVMHNKRFHDCIMRTKAAIDRERLKVSRMRVSHFFAYRHAGPTWPTTEESGGLLWEALVHHVYLVQHFLGRIDSVSAVARKVKESVYDSITLVLRGGGGAGICEYEYDVKEPLATFQLITAEGDRFDGNLTHDFLLRRSRSYRNGAPGFLRRLSDDLYEPFARRLGYLDGFFEMRPYGVFSPYRRTFLMLIRQLLSFLAGQRASPPVPAEEGLQAIRVLEAARKAIETGRAHSPE